MKSFSNQVCKRKIDPKDLSCEKRTVFAKIWLRIHIFFHPIVPLVHSQIRWHLMLLCCSSISIENHELTESRTSSILFREILWFQVFSYTCLQFSKYFFHLFQEIEMQFLIGSLTAEHKAIYSLVFSDIK